VWRKEDKKSGVGSSGVPRHGMPLLFFLIFHRNLKPPKTPISKTSVEIECNFVRRYIFI
jgi:hypothetical protein